MERMKRIFVTGGASGIGKAIVEDFCQSGHRVAFCDMNEEQGIALAASTGALFFPFDIRDVGALSCTVNELFSLWGDLDVVVNNAGISRFASITETSVGDFDDILSVNLRPVFVISRLLALHRDKQDVSPNLYGRVINIGSTRYLMSEPGSEAYAASKGAIYSLTHALSMSLSQYRITVNSISPGWIQNQAYERLLPEEHLQHPSGRVGKPEDISRMVVFLCREENDFINGENIVIDGGMTKKMIYWEPER